MNRRLTPPRTAALTLAALGLLISACSNGATTDNAATAASSSADASVSGTATESASSTASGDATTADATSELQDVDGATVGTARFTETDAGIEIDVTLTDAEPGYHGLHLHSVGLCEPDSAAPGTPDTTGAFLSAGGHLGGDTADHPEHAGDLPSILVLEDGTAALTFTTDRLTLEELDDEDGTAMMLHAGTDNYANIPERYAADGPDEDTLKTGDAGGRAACGVVEAA